MRFTQCLGFIAHHPSLLSGSYTFPEVQDIPSEAQIGNWIQATNIGASTNVIVNWSVDSNGRVTLSFENIPFTNIDRNSHCF